MLVKDLFLACIGAWAETRITVKRITDHEIVIYDGTFNDMPYEIRMSEFDYFNWNTDGLIIIIVEDE